MWPAVQTGLFVTAASHTALHGHSRRFEMATFNCSVPALIVGFSSLLDERKVALAARSPRTHTQNIWTD